MNVMAKTKIRANETMCSVIRTTTSGRFIVEYRDRNIHRDETEAFETIEELATWLFRRSAELPVGAIVKARFEVEL